MNTKVLSSFFSTRSRKNRIDAFWLSERYWSDTIRNDRNTNTVSRYPHLFQQNSASLRRVADFWGRAMLAHPKGWSQNPPLARPKGQASSILKILIEDLLLLHLVIKDILTYLFLYIQFLLEHEKYTSSATNCQWRFIRLKIFSDGTIIKLVSRKADKLVFFLLLRISLGSGQARDIEWGIKRSRIKGSKTWSLTKLMAKTNENEIKWDQVEDWEVNKDNTQTRHKWSKFQHCNQAS